MCIIVYNKRGKPLDKKQLSIAYDNNPHGFGLMWMDEEENGAKIVHKIRGMEDFNTIWSLLKKFEGVPYSLHLRWRTRGKLGTRHCHPYSILTRKKHGFDLYMQHNGTFLKVKEHEYLSDSKLFADELKRRMELNGFDLEEAIDDMSHHISSTNKLLFMSSLDGIVLVNESKGAWKDNVWYSNTYSFEKGYRDKMNRKVVNSGNLIGMPNYSHNTTQQKGR